MTMKIKCVTGAPGSGKSTYVREHHGDNDIIYDFDLMAQAITGKEAHSELTEGQSHALGFLRYSINIVFEC